MDLGAHFYHCDFQVHSPRDTNWSGSRPATDEDRMSYAVDFVAACRVRGLGAVAITDHHDFAFFSYIKRAAQDERGSDGEEVPPEQKLVVFPGMELTLGVPCQAILILDADFPTEFLPPIYAILSIQANSPNEPTHAPVQCLEHLKDLAELHSRLDENESLRGRYILLPNVSESGNTSLLRSRFKAHYKQMPCVGGYLDGAFSQLKSGNLRIVNGKDVEYGHKAIGVFPTSDNRHADFSNLGKHTAWVKWARPTAEALRQACLARHSRILHGPPELPSVIIQSLEVTNSKFLGPIVLEFNSQYNCLIGGRGTGKSTILEYLRWALCDQPPPHSGADDEIPDFQAKRSSLIANTLAPHEAVVTVGFSVNGVPHLVRRASRTSHLSLKIAGRDFRECTEQEVRDLLPIRAYSQKQLSAVGVRTDELIRFIEAPIKKELDEVANLVKDSKARIRANYQQTLRKRALEGEMARDELAAESLQQQIDALRDGLAGLSDADKATLSRHDVILGEERIILAWIRELDRLENSVRSVANEISSMPRPLPDGTPIYHRELIDEISAKMRDIVAEVKGHVDAAALLLGASSDQRNKLAEVRRRWTAKQDAHNSEYEAVKQRASSHETQLKQIGTAEDRLKSIRSLIAENKDKLATFGKPEEVYQKAKREWVAVYKKRADILQRKCEELTALSDGRIRAAIRRGAGTEAAQERLSGLIVGTSIRGRKVEELFARMQKAEYPAGDWERALGELEELISWGAQEASAKLMPELPLLTSAGFSDKDLERIAKKLSLNDWLDLSLIELTDLPKFEYQQRENTYIEFKDASAGQQATALLRVLLNQEGPPLVIDQPEDDLDNQVILEIVEEIWKAKMKRQVLFSSHNANLVVNGDADLVVICDYRTLSDQSGGCIKNQGAIDVDSIRREITAVMEGGKEAFRMRKEKYGF